MIREMSVFVFFILCFCIFFLLSLSWQIKNDTKCFERKKVRWQYLHVVDE